jgi:type IX secretion system PorP/SprF family membrane protein
MSVKSFFIACALLFFAASEVFAQQDPLFTNYMFNNLYVTPAFAGVDGVTRLTAFYRNQWTGYQAFGGAGGAPITQMVSFNTPIYKLRSGFGAYVLNDDLGPQNNLTIQAMYAYHLGVKDNKLSIGVKVGAFSQSINGAEYKFIDQNDNSIITGKESQVKPDLGFGLFYRSEKYYAGIGFNHLLRSQFDFGANDVRNALENHVNFTAGYFYEMSFDLNFQFSTLVKTDLNKTSVDLSAIAFYKSKMWGGLGFRQSEAASVLLGYSFLKDRSLRFGYSMDYIVKAQDAKQPTSHEFMISYELPVNPGSGKKIVRTPRYRH